MMWEIHHAVYSRYSTHVYLVPYLFNIRCFTDIGVGVGGGWESAACWLNGCFMLTLTEMLSCNIKPTACLVLTMLVDIIHDESIVRINIAN